MAGGHAASSGWSKEAGGPQAAIASCAGSLKLPRRGPGAATGRAGRLAGLRGKAKPTKAARGKARGCLRLAAGSRAKGGAWASAHGFLAKLLGALPEGMAGEEGAAAPSALLKAGFGSCGLLGKGKRKLCRAAAAPALRAGAGARPGAQLAAPPHPARVGEPGQRGWRKLARAARHLPAALHFAATSPSAWLGGGKAPIASSKISSFGALLQGASAGALASASLLSGSSPLASSHSEPLPAASFPAASLSSSRGGHTLLSQRPCSPMLAC